MSPRIDINDAQVCLQAFARNSKVIPLNRSSGFRDEGIEEKTGRRSEDQRPSLFVSVIHRLKSLWIKSSSL